MYDTSIRARRDVPTTTRRREALSTVVVMVTAVSTLGVLAVTGRDGSTGRPQQASLVASGGPSVQADAPTPPEAATLTGALPDLDVVDDGVVEAVPEMLAEDCVIEPETLRTGAAGTDVSCLQQALERDGFLEREPTGEYDQRTSAAVQRLKEEREPFVDGVAGRETALSIGVWPDESANVIRTPPPAAGAVDEMGFALSSVSSVGDDAPPLPDGSGSGRRVVYERAGQRAWAVADDGHIIRSWLVTGSQYDNEMPRTHQVYSRSEQSTAWNGKAILPLMIRYQRTQIGHIGFHGIPLHVEDGSAYQTEADLGTRLSGGCQRQANPDAAFMCAFADVGTTVVVI